MPVQGHPQFSKLQVVPVASQATAGDLGVAWYCHLYRGTCPDIVSEFLRLLASSSQLDDGVEYSYACPTSELGGEMKLCSETNYSRQECETTQPPF